MTKSQVPACNAPERVEVPKEYTPYLVLGASKNNKRTRNSVSQVPNSRRRPTKVGNEGLLQPIAKVPQRKKKGSQLRPGDGMESQEVGIPDLNLPTQEGTSENARAEIDAGKLKDLAPIVRNYEEKMKKHLKVQPMMK